VILDAGNRKNTLFLFLILFGCCLTFNAQSTVDLDKVQRAIVFLYGADQHGHENASAPLATGFFTVVPFKNDPLHGPLLLITARHVLDPVWAGCAPVNPTRLFMRLNAKDFDPSKDDTGVKFVQLDLIWSGRNRNVFTTVDSSVDAAVLTLPNSITKEVEKSDVGSIDIVNFATRDEARALTSGAEIVSAGLLPDFPGVRRNYPIMKFGHVSTKPQERVRVHCGFGGALLSHPLHFWFIAANLVGGNSGSPILFKPPLYSGQRATLIGLQSTSWEGSDIAGMTPIEDIFEIIEVMELPDADLYRGPPREPKKP
jgi:hypothetical protein